MAKQEKKKYVGDAYGIAGFVFAIASLVLLISFNLTVFPFFSILFGIISLALSVKQQMNKKTGLALAGIILSIISIVLGIILFSWLVVLIQKALEEISKLQTAAGSLGGAEQLGALG